MAKVREFVKKIPAAWQAMMVLLAIFLAGAAFSGILGLPDQVSANTNAIQENSNRIHQIEDSHVDERNLLLRMLCNQDPEESFETCERKYSGLVDGLGGPAGGG